ncbi:hypothetical protein [Herbiconiux sp.]|uniref:hypothetical protein n=1 Tax=Herbiconiux sp. TaxID=1871186 RepID=UPI0025BAF989|nr:hypothetical protein [Herbiconiux sp.]
MVQQQQHTGAFDLSALNERIDRHALREFRRRFAAPRRHPVARVLGFLGGAVLILFLGLYLSDWELELVPWLSLGIAVLWVIAWVLTQRAARRRILLRHRVSRLAEANALTIEFDRHDEMPARLAALGAPGTEPITLIRLRSTSASPAGALPCLEIGLHAHEEVMPHATSATATVLTVYVLRAARFDAVASADPLPSSEPPALAIGPASDEVQIRYEATDAARIAVFADPADFGDPATWRRISAVTAWLAVA